MAGANTKTILVYEKTDDLNDVLASLEARLAKLNAITPTAVESGTLTIQIVEQVDHQDTAISVLVARLAKLRAM